MDDTNGENQERAQAPTQPALPAAAPPYYAPPPPPATRGLRMPGVALVLSFLFPGAGQIYNGQMAKALFVFFAFAGSIYGVIEAGPIPFALCIPFVYFFNIIDAYRSAVLINNRAAGAASVPEDEGFESPVWGASLVALGLLLFLNNVGWLRLASVARFWPLILIAAGAVFIYQATSGKKDRPSGGSDAFLS
jgi:TM2 domain-containing membrane protein YozV